MTEETIRTETEDEILARHRKETRDMVARVTGMKKQATKSKKKEVMRRCQELEQELKTKHERELDALHGVDNSAEEGEEEITPEMLLAQLEISKQQQEETKDQVAQPQQQQEAKPKKKNRAKERLARRDAALQEARAEAEAEASAQPDLRAIEMSNLEQLCKMNSLKQHDITPDGHCLFASIADQLKVRQGIDASVAELRQRAATHIKNDPNTYAPFLFDEKMMTMRDIDSYTEEISNTALWGGDMEIMALAEEYDCPISVMISGAATLIINDKGNQPELKLVYYKHSFGLGEHYNSLRDVETVA